MGEKIKAVPSGAGEAKREKEEKGAQVMKNETQQEIIVHTDEVPEFRRIALAKCVLASLEQDLLDPNSEAEFQAWLKEYKKEKARKERG